jgi:arylsulfatase A-like enzyme
MRRSWSILPSLLVSAVLVFASGCEDDNSPSGPPDARSADSAPGDSGGNGPYVDAGATGSDAVDAPLPADTGAPDGAGLQGLDAGGKIDGGQNPMDASVAKSKRVIVFVWDGLRPDSVDATNTPRLAAMAAQGVWFSDNHATYPTFTMMNAASFATGNFPGATGFYGNTFWQEGPTGKDSAGATVDFNQPIFTEDYGILLDLQNYYGGKLLLIGTLFQAAQKAGLVTAAVGKSGAAFLQDIGEGGYILDEKFAYPLAFAKDLQAGGYALPRLTPNAYAAGSITLATTNGDPTGASGRKNFADTSTSDPTDQGGTPYAKANSYMMGIYLDVILAQKDPDLSLIWFRNPDSTEHAYGPGTANYRDALKSQDSLLGMLQDKLGALGLAATTDVIVVSDHGHSSVSGPLGLFPLRSVKPDPAGSGNTWGDPDPNGFSVSGDVRLADLMTKAGFVAYDGVACTWDPVMSGIMADGTSLYPTKVDSDGSVCGHVGGRSATPAYLVPAGALPAKAVVIAANGGSEYLYVPDHDAATVASAVRFLQSREEFGAIFVASGYGNLPGTLSLDKVRLENSAGRNPDIVASYDYDETAVVQGLKGIEFESAQNNRGMHGTFSPIDVHNTLVARGPRFKSAMQNTLPSGNVDVAPTVATILGFSLPSAAGRSLDEALAGGRAAGDYAVASSTLAPAAPATGLSMVLPSNAADPSKTSYTFGVKVKDLSIGTQSYRYFDSAKAVRQ